MSKELARVQIAPKDSMGLSAKMESLNQAKARLGDYDMEVAGIRERFAAQLEQAEKEMAAIRNSIKSQYSEIRDMSQYLMKTYEIDSTQEGWVLNVFEGAFIRTEPDPEGSALSHVSERAKESAAQASNE